MEATDELIKKVADNIGKIQLARGPQGMLILAPQGILMSTLSLNAQLSRVVLESIARVAIASIPRKSR